jgi:hypothetical protein
MSHLHLTARVTAAAAVGVVLLAGGCSGDPSSAPTPSDASSAGPPSGPVSSSRPEVPRPDGLEADISQPLTGGGGVFMGSSAGQALDPGYVEEEYAAEGRATAYASVGPLTSDGVWTFRPTDQARYRTRIVVRRPAAGTSAGVVLVEWLNVSGGLDADPAYQTLREEIVRQGYTWVGVSAQKIGVEGGAVAVAPDIPGAADVVGKGLKAIDPERYGSLHHPGDRFAFDIVTQVARALRSGGPATGGSVPAQVLALGESQAAFGLVTYVNGVQPLTRAFDGFFVESRSGSSMVMPDGADAADLAATILGPPTTFRADTDVPVFDVQTETDVVGILGSFAARQPDTDRFRLWEVSGTAHADLHLVGQTVADSLDCGAPINDGPLHVVAKAALRHFVTWVTDGAPPPTVPLIEVSSAGVTRDADGIAVGGLRTPPVDVPVRVLTGDPGRDDEPLCLLFGTTRPLPEPRLAELYAGRADYEQRYAEGVDGAIAAGFVLPEDRAALMGYAHPELVRP